MNATQQPWTVPANQARCAGVSSFGIGGTNAHVIVQEAPAQLDSGTTCRTHQLIPLSAKTPEALTQATDNLQAHLQQTTQPFADVAYTLSCGRTAFRERRFVLGADAQDAATQLASPETCLTQRSPDRAPRIAYLLPGQGAQHPGMTAALYTTEATFRQTVDECAALLQPHLDCDIRSILYPTDPTEDRIHQTCYTQPALFVVEYALATLWNTWGLQPAALLGHSIGEYVAACLAGVISLPDALGLVALRGQLMQSLPAGDMLALPLSEQQAQAWCSDNISLAVINAPKRTVLAGEPAAIATLHQALQAEGIKSTKLHTSHAFHSHMLEPILAPFAEHLGTIPLHPPQIPYLSNLRGDWITTEDATNPDYWVQHLRHTVRFADNVAQLATRELDIMLETGPGRVLSTLARQHPATPKNRLTLHSLAARKVQDTEPQHLLNTLGQLWLQGAPIDWAQVYALEQRRRVPLPTYPFARKRYWIDPPTNKPVQPATDGPAPLKQQQTEPTEPKNTVISTVNLTDTEYTLAALWRQSLGNTEITAATDFFTAGGDSLLATQLIAQVNAKFNITLDTHCLIQASTLSQLAQHIEAQQTTQKPSPNTETNTAPYADLIVPLQTGDPTRKPLVLLYPVGGHVYFYRELAQHLDPQQPVYCIRTQGTEGEASLLTTLQEMAHVSLVALRTLQTNGPYYLGGSSFGGVLAYEMAQQLLTVGEEIAYLGMIDSPGPSQMPTTCTDDAAEVLYMYMLNIGTSIQITLEDLRCLSSKQQASQALRMMGQDDTPAAHRSLHQALVLFHTNLKALIAYQPVPYPGAVHYYLARERDADHAQIPVQAWIPLVKNGISVYTVPGNHISMNAEPHVQQLATHVQKNLDRTTV